MPVVFDASYIIKASKEEISNAFRRFKDEIFYITPDLDLNILKNKDPNKYEYLIKVSQKKPLYVLVAKKIFSKSEIEEIHNSFKNHGLKVHVIEADYPPEVEIKGKKLGVEVERAKEVYKFYEDMKRKIKAIEFEEIIRSARDIGVKTDIMLNCIDPKKYKVLSFDDDIVGPPPTIRFVNYARRSGEIKKWTLFLVWIILPFVIGAIRKRTEKI